ncbi:hypothetical protein Bbelb_276440 [Branchiostoma belcheri]|nr:hypothetical protein Bbelb_276440 [Branchiostoma belcheri]
MLDSTGEHYKPFTEAYGRETTEADRLSLKVSRTTGHVAHGKPFSPNADFTRGVVMCLDCNKPMTVHNQRALIFEQRDQLKQLKEEAMYTCWVSLAPEDHPLRDICFVSSVGKQTSFPSLQSIHPVCQGETTAKEEGVKEDET